jgi:hypothetical protein
MKEKLIFLILLALLLVPHSANLALADDPGIPDTCRGGCSDITLPGQQVVVGVSVYNDEALGGLVVPLVFGYPSLDVVCDSVSFVGTRVEGAEYLGIKIDTANYKLLFYAIWISSDLPVGDGIVANLYFTTGSNWDSTLCVRIDTTFYPPTTTLEFTPRSTGRALRPKLQKGCLGSGIALMPELKSPLNQAILCSPDTFPFVWSKSGEGVSYTLQYAQDSNFTTGVVTTGGITDTTYAVSLPGQTYYWHVKTTNQCGKDSPYQDQPSSFYVFKSGDVTDNGVVDVGDVVFLISFLYKGGTAPNIPESADLVHDGALELGDLVYLINFLYKNGTAPTCP